MPPKNETTVMCDGPKESAHLHIDGLRRLFA